MERWLHLRGALPPEVRRPCVSFSERHLTKVNKPSHRLSQVEIAFQHDVCCASLFGRLSPTDQCFRDTRRHSSCKKSLSESLSLSGSLCLPLCILLSDLLSCVSFSVIGFPSKEDWPTDSPISYSVNWGPKRSCTKLLHNLGPEENDLLSVSTSGFSVLITSHDATQW